MRIKVCGITNLEDAEAAQRLGAWGIGLNHHPGSPRVVDPDAAAGIGAALKRRLEVVGVFVNAPLREVERAVDSGQLTMVQLHGDEGPAYCAEVARRTGAKVIKAFQVRSGADVQAAGAYRTDFHLFDAHSLVKRGGTGETFDWDLAATHGRDIPLMLAGGLRPDNVAEAIEIVRPFAVDVTSGVEAEPGRKDPALLEEFFAAANSVDAPTQTTAT
jgi:phosphoribosylanthranilate isomerase